MSWFQFSAPVGGLDTCPTVQILSENESFFFSCSVPSYYHPLSFSLLVRPSVTSHLPTLLPWLRSYVRKEGPKPWPPQLRLGPRTWGVHATHSPLKLRKTGVDVAGSRCSWRSTWQARILGPTRLPFWGLGSLQGWKLGASLKLTMGNQSEPSPAFRGGDRRGALARCPGELFSSDLRRLSGGLVARDGVRNKLKKWRGLSLALLVSPLPSLCISCGPCPPATSGVL